MTENDILALSWKQPFASLMLCGKIETRVWKTKYRGEVLICASKKSYSLKELNDICGQYQLYRIFDTLHCDLGCVDDLCGLAIAIGRLVDCRPMQKTDEDNCFALYNPDLWCHVYEDVREIKPFPFRGKQGWSKLDKTTFDKIEYINYEKDLREWLKK
jgi:hypothetical protein